MQIEVPDFWLFTIFILIEQLHMLYAFIIQFHNYRFRAVLLLLMNAYHFSFLSGKQEV